MGLRGPGWCTGVWAAPSTGRWSPPSVRRSATTRSARSACTTPWRGGAPTPFATTRSTSPPSGCSGRPRSNGPRVFRTTLGVRGDFYRYNVDAVRALNTGAGTSALVSPKLTAVLGPWQGTELYLNYGQGFHSNDPRAATTVVDPISGERVASEDPLVPGPAGPRSVCERSPCRACSRPSRCGIWPSIPS